MWPAIRFDASSGAENGAFRSGEFVSTTAMIFSRGQSR